MSNKEILEKYNYEDATHRLLCRHQIGASGSTYYMRCILLGLTKSRKAKVLVFGERYWKYKRHVKKIRYVESFRVTAITEAEREKE